MTSLSIAALALLLITPLLVIVALVDLSTMSPARRIRLYRRSGASQQAIADRLGVTRYAVRSALAGA